MKRGFFTIMSAQFFSSLADNAIFIAAIELLRAGGPQQFHRGHEQRVVRQRREELRRHDGVEAALHRAGFGGGSGWLDAGEMTAVSKRGGLYHAQ